MNELKITSITYVKNGQEYIRQCIQSIIDQTLKEIEIIVVDGGSTDGTVEIIEELKEKDDRIQLLNVEGSVGKQFNAALKIARGRFVAVCEGDDFIEIDKYEKQYAIADEYNLDVLRACYSLYFRAADREYKYKVEVAPKAELYDRLIISDDNMFLGSFVNGYWNGLYSRDFLLSNEIFKNETKGAAFQDITFSFLTQMYAKRIYFMSESLHCYRVDNPNSSVNSEKCFQLLNTEYGLLADILKQRGMWDIQKHMFFGWIISSYKQFFDRFSIEVKEAIFGPLYENLQSYGIDYEDIDLQMYKPVMELRKDFYVGEECFRSAMFSNNEELVKLSDFFRSDKFKKETDLILFGAGHFGGIVLDYLLLLNKNAIIVDNSKEKQISGYNGHNVYDASVCSQESTKTIIVANVNYANDIRKQLLDMSIDESRIVVCDNEDFFIREILMRSIFDGSIKS